MFHTTSAAGLRADRSRIAQGDRQALNLRALFTTAVWGADYVDRFLNYSLRTQLSAGNLGAFDTNSVFLLMTDMPSFRRITASPIYGALTDLVRVEHVDIQNIRVTSKDKYSLLTACQNYVLSQAVDFDALFFGYGDALWAEGSYAAAARRLAEGYDVVFSFGYPVLDKPFKSVVAAVASDGDMQAVTISPRTFARHVYRKLHPMAQANRWSNQWMSHCPSYVTWDVPGQGLLVRAFHLHPVAVRVHKESKDFFRPFYTTLDEGFVEGLFRSHPRVYVCTSSDEFGVCSLAAPTNLAYTMEPRRCVNVYDLAKFAEGYAGLLHRELFNRSIRLLIDDPDEDLWRASEIEAAKIAAAVGDLVSIPDSVLALEYPAAFRARVHRRIRYQRPPDAKVFIGRRGGSYALARMARALVGSTLRLRFLVRTVRVLRSIGVIHAAKIVILPLLPKMLLWRLRYVVYSLSAAPEISRERR